MAAWQEVVRLIVGLVRVGSVGGGGGMDYQDKK